jgi:hypothetical protein
MADIAPNDFYLSGKVPGFFLVDFSLKIKAPYLVALFEQFWQGTAANIPKRAR